MYVCEIEREREREREREEEEDLKRRPFVRPAVRSKKRRVPVKTRVAEAADVWQSSQED